MPWRLGGMSTPDETHFHLTRCVNKQNMWKWVANNPWKLHHCIHHMSPFGILFCMSKLSAHGFTRKRSILLNSFQIAMWTIVWTLNFFLQNIISWSLEEKPIVYRNRNVANKGHWKSGSYEFSLKNDDLYLIMADKAEWLEIITN